MATAHRQKIGGGYLNAGASANFKWNNPPAVINFWAQPKQAEGSEIALVPLAFQVTGVTCTMDTVNHYVATVTIKNTSANGGNYELYMSYLG
jgi:hypothetical protein